MRAWPPTRSVIMISEFPPPAQHDDVLHMVQTLHQFLRRPAPSPKHAHLVNKIVKLPAGSRASGVICTSSSTSISSAKYPCLSTRRFRPVTTSCANVRYLREKLKTVPAPHCQLHLLAMFSQHLELSLAHACDSLCGQLLQPLETNRRQRCGVKHQHEENIFSLFSSFQKMSTKQKHGQKTR